MTVKKHRTNPIDLKALVDARLGLRGAEALSRPSGPRGTS